jgi:hypothetical protein
MKIDCKLALFLNVLLGDLFQQRIVAANPITGTIHHPKLQPSLFNALPGQFIVEVHPEYSPIEEISDFFEKVRDGYAIHTPKIVHLYDHVMNGFAMKSLSDSHIPILLNNTHVKAVWSVSKNCNKQSKRNMLSFMFYIACGIIA